MSEERRQIDELILRKDLSVGRMGMNILLGYEFLSFFIDRILILNPRKLEFMTYAHVYEILAALTALVFAKTHPKWMLRLHLPCILPLYLRYLVLLFDDVHVMVAQFPLLKGTLSASLVGVFIIVLTPQSRVMVPAAVTLFFSACMSAVIWRTEDGPATALISSIGYFAAFAWKYSQIRGRREAAGLEIRNRQLIVQAERGRIQIEMDLASAIQDSMRPTTSLVSGPLTADFYMLKHGSVGGDWFAAQVRPDGAMLVLVVDATGKGLQAALVVHAVQSLWTAAMSDETFDPKAWILRVNDVLTAMGQGSAHTVTLGLAEIRRARVTYWSAGHGPIFLVRESTRARITGHFAAGSMLGIGPSHELTLNPTHIVLDPSKAEAIYLGTDGVLVGSARKDAKTIESLEVQLPLRGAEALGDTGIEDDKALVRIALAPVSVAKAG